MNRSAPESDPMGTELPDPEALLSLPLLNVRDLGVVVERFLEGSLADRGVSLMEVRVLAACAAQPGITAVEISNAIPVEPPAISRLVNLLAEKRLLSRRRSRADRRAVRLRATDEGLASLRECQPLLEQACAEFLASLNQPQARSFLRSVSTLLSAGS